MSARFYDFGPFRIDTVNHVLMRDRQVLSLKPKVFDTLLILVENRSQLVDKEDLMRRLWPDTIVEESNLSQNIYLLRKVLGEDPEGQQYIETMPRRGYRFLALVTQSDTDLAVTSVGPLVAAEIPPVTLTPQSSRSLLSRRRLQRTVAIGIILTGLVVTIFYVRRVKQSEFPAAPQVKSIAILPFKSLNADRRDLDLGFGMADTLITRLTTLRQLQVRPTSAVRKFTAEQDPLAAGRELKVDAVMDASMQRIGDRIRVNWQLVRVSDGTAIGAGIIDQQADDYFALQDAVSEQLAQALVLQMSGDERKRFVKRHTANTEAYHLYMLGRYQRNRLDADGWKLAIDYFNRAIEKDPNYALAYAGLADCYSSSMADALMTKAEAIPKAKEAATMALRLDEMLSETHVSSARISAYYDWDWAAADREFQRAIELDPNSASAHAEYGGFLAALGRGDQAIAEAKQARELDPSSLPINFGVAWALLSARRFDEAIEESKRLVDTFPQAHFWIGLAYIGKGSCADAIVAFEKRLSLSKDDTLITKAHLAYCYGALNNQAAAKKIIAEVNQLPNQQSVSPYYLAIIFAGLRDNTRAFASLEESYKQRSRPLWGLKVNPVWDNLRSDERFGNLLRRVGLPS